MVKMKFQPAMNGSFSTTGRGTTQEINRVGASGNLGYVEPMRDDQSLQSHSSGIKQTDDLVF
jgi:hypothetical protein